MAMKKFKAESQKLLDLMINSIYTNKEIFLRELISNASDALDKLRFKGLTDDSVGLGMSDFAITLTPNKESRTLKISDNGIGMTKEELENNLGTIAKSGSLDFKKENTAEDIDIIGQFGVGFYSAFMVASRVTVVSRAFGSEEAWKWNLPAQRVIPLKRRKRTRPAPTSRFISRKTPKRKIMTVLRTNTESRRLSKSTATISVIRSK